MARIIPSFSTARYPSPYDDDEDLTPVFANGQGGAIRGIKPRRFRSYPSPSAPRQAASDGLTQPPQAPQYPPPPMSFEDKQADVRNQGMQATQNIHDARASANLADTIQAKRAQQQRQATFIDAYRQNIARMQAGGGGAPGAPAAPAAPQAAPTTQPAAPDGTTLQESNPDYSAKDSTLPGQQKNPDGTQTITMNTVIPGQLGTPGLSPRDAAGNELQRRRYVEALRGRGLDGPGNPYVTPPGYTGTPGTPDVPTAPVTRTFKTNQGAYGLSREQLDNARRDADQQALAGSLHDRADAGGYYTGQGIIGAENARQDALVGGELNHMAADYTRAAAQRANAETNNQLADKRGRLLDAQADQTLDKTKNPQKYFPPKQAPTQSGNVDEKLLNHWRMEANAAQSMGDKSRLQFAQEQMGAAQARLDAANVTSAQSHQAGQQLPKGTNYKLPDGTMGVAGTPPGAAPTTQPSAGTGGGDVTATGPKGQRLRYDRATGQWVPL